MTLTAIKGKSMMTTAEALDQIIGLRDEGKSFAEITEVLKANGYRSSKTNEPIKEQMVRYMYTKAKGELPPSRLAGAAKSKRAAAKAAPIEVSKGPKGELYEIAKSIFNNEAVSVEYRLKAIRNLLNEDDSQRVSQ